MITDQEIIAAIPQVLKSIDIPQLGDKMHGKVRDFYCKDNTRILITTDRQSAFDINLGFIPFKGAVLNQLSAFWFEQTRDIIDSHMISVPDPNVMVGKNCQGIPIEMIVRGYITGSTNTSIWHSYKQGERHIYGLDFPEGLRKNQKLPKPIITPTTHGGGTDGHDERMTRAEILSSGIISQSIYKQMEEATYALYERGVDVAEKAGLILPDTKYEFGLYDGELLVIDELHTPDGSRFWIQETYKEKFERGEEPDNFDKEFIRLWYTKRIDPYKDPIPEMPQELIISAAHRYIDVYEKLIGKQFQGFSYPIQERILDNLRKHAIIV